MPQEILILVDENDVQTGLAEKMEVHEKGLLHRAFSVFVFNDKHELLLQKRAQGKYHSPGLWTNTCCSHPREGESVLEAGKRRLQEEMGMACELEMVFSFIYRAEFDNGLIEHEFDHVLVGFSNTEPQPDKEEVDSFTYLNINAINDWLDREPEAFTAWFRICWPTVVEKLKDIA